MTHAPAGTVTPAYCRTVVWRRRARDEAASTLAAIRASAAYTGVLGTSERLTIDRWEALSAGERKARTDAGIAAVRRLTDHRAWADRIRTLGRLRHEPAVPILVDLWTRCPVQPVEVAAAHALFEIGTPEARAALRAGIDDHEHLGRFMALKVAFTDEGDPWDRLGPLFGDERLASRSGRVVAGDALAFLSPSFWTRDGARWHVEALRNLLATDRRWLDLCVSLRHDDVLGTPAREALRAADPAVTGPALDAAAAAAAARPRPRPPAIAAGSLLTRYEQGDHQAVWREIQEVEALDDAWRAEAERVAEATMRRVLRGAERLVAALAAAGWPIEPRRALPGPPADVEERLRSLERLTGAPAPPALAAFWRIVGSLSLVPEGDAPLPAGVPDQLGLLDPIEVDDLSTTWFEVEEWQERAAGLHPELAGPIELPIAPDHLHKANISGGAPYAVWLPFAGADPIVREERHELPFTDYLRVAFERRGFVGLAGASEHAEAARWLAGIRVDLEPF